MDAEQLAKALVDLSAWAEEHRPSTQDPIADRLVAHLGVPASEAPVVGFSLPDWDRPNLQRGLDAALEREGWSAEVHGLLAFGPADLGHLLVSGDSPYGGPVRLGAARTTVVEVGDERVRCLDSALILATGPDGPAVLRLGAGDEEMGRQGLRLQVAASRPEVADGLVVDVRTLMAERNVYRGRVVELRGGFEGQELVVRELAEVPRERIVLPDGLLDHIERHAVGISRHADRLLAAGRHLRRGILLHGPPGTGKTLTVMHLATQPPRRTVVLLSGEALGALEPACELARQLAPATVVLEDVDLVAMDRMDPGSGGLLFQLLDEMDGLKPDEDVLFVLTTNRPDRLEGAIAQRPGRIDLAAEIPLPDEAGLLALLELYGEGLDLRLESPQEVAQSMQGATPALVKEVLRRAALDAAERREDGPLVVADVGVLAAFRSLSEEQQALRLRRDEDENDWPGEWDDGDDVQIIH